MLLSFKIKNFRSFKGEQEISFVLNEDECIDPERIFEVNTENGKIRILKNAIIYGANASGKTNILLALQTLKQIIMYPTGSDNEGLFSDTFAFNRDNTRFEIKFLKENIIFDYHLEYNRSEVVYENLYKNDVIVFERSYQEFKFPSLNESAKNLLEIVRKTGLLIFFAQHYNVEDTKKAFSWFFAASSPPIVNSLTTNKLFKENVLYALRFADFNILDIEVEEKQIYNDGIIVGLNINNEAEIVPKKAIEVYFIHDNNGNRFRIPLQNESQGTRTFFEFILFLLNPDSENYSYFQVDELDLSLHKKLTSNLVRLLNSKNNFIQCIATSHDSSLMDILRPSQIYFVEKSVEGVSEIFKLSDFDDISNDDKYASEYEDGLYGADQIINEAGLMSILG